jgi:hypothetical protein
MSEEKKDSSGAGITIIGLVGAAIIYGLFKILMGTM